MKIELLSENKIKLFLTPDDLVDYGLTYERLNYDEPDTKRAFKDMLKRVKEATGVSLESSRLLVEARPTSSAGCMLTITKQERNRNQKRVIPTHKYFFSFATADDFLDFRNVAKPFSAQYDVYFVEENFYVTFEEKENAESFLVHIASEFGEKCSFYIESILEERAERVRIS